MRRQLASPEPEQQPADARGSEKIYSNDHGDVVILYDASGKQIAKVGLDSQTVTYPDGTTRKVT